MQKLDDPSRSLTALKPDGTLIAVLSQVRFGAKGDLLHRSKKPDIQIGPNSKKCLRNGDAG